MIAELVVYSVVTLAIAAFVASILPGFERKIQARIQQRIGPPLFTPGFWSIIKFAYKKRITPNSPGPGFYHAFVVVSLASVTAILLFSTPYWWGVLGFGSLFALVGLLKVEEVMYLFMGNFSRSVMSATHPTEDRVEGARFRDAPLAGIEGQAALRALKMVTVGSFPLYLAMFIPFVMASSIAVGDVVVMQNPAYRSYLVESVTTGTTGSFVVSLSDTVEMLSSLKPLLFTLPGLLAAILYFLGFNIVTNNRPFDIIKPKVDVIEGPIMEYAALWRALAYLLNALLSFTMASLFVAFFIGLPLDVRLVGPFLIHVALCFALPAGAAVLRAFSPVLTFRQIYPISISGTIAGIVVIGLTYLV